MIARTSKINLSLASLVVANMVPLVGVLWLGWNAAGVILLYWVENLVIGGYNVLKMATAGGWGRLGHISKLFFIPFFIVHFGGFCMGHGIFLFLLLNMAGGIDTPSIETASEAIACAWSGMPPGAALAVLGLAASHGVSFVQNYLLKREYASATAPMLMMQPYSRIIVLHIAIIAGGMLTVLAGAPVILLVMLIVIKTIVDISAHVRMHRKMQAEPATPATHKEPAKQDVL